jgi:hypothetical protein
VSAARRRRMAPASGPSGSASSRSSSKIVAPIAGVRRSNCGPGRTPSPTLRVIPASWRRRRPASITPLGIFALYRRSRGMARPRVHGASGASFFSARGMATDKSRTRVRTARSSGERTPIPSAARRSGHRSPRCIRPPTLRGRGRQPPACSQRLPAGRARQGLGRQWLAVGRCSFPGRRGPPALRLAAAAAAQPAHWSCGRSGSPGQIVVPVSQVPDLGVSPSG